MLSMNECRLRGSADWLACLAGAEAMPAPDRAATALPAASSGLSAADALHSTTLPSSLAGALMLLGAPLHMVKSLCHILCITVVRFVVC
jgi:hypothetical protein